MKYLLILLCLAFSGCNQSPASRIEKVLNKCAALSAESSGQATPDAKIDYFIRGTQAIDTSKCPPEFRVAFQEHVNAWLRYQSAASQNTLGNNILEGAVAGASGNMNLIGQTAGNASAANDYVNETYFRLTEIAAAHGARVPRSVIE
jgi:hypothetical protein